MNPDRWQNASDSLYKAVGLELRSFVAGGIAGAAVAVVALVAVWMAFR